MIPSWVRVKLSSPELRSRIHFQIIEVITTDAAQGTIMAQRTNLRPGKFWLINWAIGSEMTTVKKTTRNTQITVRSAITDKLGFANKSRKFCSPLKPPSAPASEIFVNDIFTNSIAGQITTNKINATAGPIHGSADIREFFLRCLRAVATVIVNAISSPTNIINPINPAKFF